MSIKINSLRAFPESEHMDTSELNAMIVPNIVPTKEYLSFVLIKKFNLSKENNYCVKSDDLYKFLNVNWKVNDLITIEDDKAWVTPPPFTDMQSIANITFPYSNLNKDYYVTDNGYVYKRGGVIVNTIKTVYGKWRRFVLIDNQLYPIATLVAALYIPNPHGYRRVYHIDGDGNNEAVDNLHWGPVDANKEIDEYWSNKYHLICKDIVENKLGGTEIAKKHNVSYDLVLNIFNNNVGPRRREIINLYKDKFPAKLHRRNLSEEKVKLYHAICKDIVNGMSHNAISRKYNIRADTVSALHRRQRKDPDILAIIDQYYDKFPK